MRVFWPVTLAAAALVGLLAYGIAARHTSTTLDDVFVYYTGHGLTSHDSVSGGGAGRKGK